jgi:transcription antitermination factor NusG
LPINQAAYKLLSSNVGREVAVEASTPSPYGDQRPEVVIPLPPTKNVDLPSKVVKLSPGVQVRVIREPHFGAVGTVTELISQAVRYQSGALARSVTVELEGIGRETLPVSNLEVLQ